MSDSPVLVVDLNDTMITRHLLRARSIPHQSFSRIIHPTFTFIRIAKMSTSTPPKLQHVAIETEEGIAVIKYNRPKNGNALNTPTLKDILEGLRWADAEENVRVVITTGAGKFYTAGRFCG